MILEILLGILGLLGLLMLRMYRWTKKGKNYWQERGIRVPSYPSMFPFGNAVPSNIKVLFGRENQSDIALKQGSKLPKNILRYVKICDNASINECSFYSVLFRMIRVSVYCSLEFGLSAMNCLRRSVMECTKEPTQF